MPTGTTTVTKVMDLIASRAAGVDGLDASRVYQGRRVFAESEDPDADLRAEVTETEAAFAFWVKAREFGTQTRPGTLTVGGRLQVAVHAYLTTDGNKTYDLLEALMDALNTESVFAPLGARPIRPSGFRESDEVYPDGLAVFEVTLTYAVGVSGGA